MKFRQFVKYSVNGGLGYVVDFSLIVLFTRIGLDRYSASVLAYSLALVQTFLGSHFVVFKSGKSPRKTVVPYILLGVLCQSIALMMQAGGAYFEVSVPITRLLTYPLTVVVSLYLQSRIFNRKPTEVPLHEV